jgi:surface polysaccharide O-acyltransferase-like enzyme
MSNANVGKKKSKRIFYFDALRALAIISVILFHIFNVTRVIILPEYALIPTWNWIIGDTMATCFRCGVDLFLMLSGALSLGRVWDIKSFLGKRIPRITAPFLFWGFVLSLLLVYLTYTFPDIIHTYKPANIEQYLAYLWHSYLGKTKGFTPYWFFWMILGTYLIMPVLNRWLYNSDLKEAEYFLAIWAVTCIFGSTLNVDFPIVLTYFTGPIGMVVLGYYLRHTKRKMFNNPYISLFILLIGAFSLLIISYINSNNSEFYIYDRYNILMVVEVIGIFTFFKNFEKFNINLNSIDKPVSIFKKAVFSIAKYSYGIYLIHRFFLTILYDGLHKYFLFKPLIIILFIGTLVISWVLLTILNRVPYLNQIIGSK